MKARILYDDGSGRFHVGEIGTLIECTFSKYDYFLRLEGAPDFPFQNMKREFYFHKGELELIPEEES
jgi:hypothetical protein